MRVDEELATDELKREEPDITEKLIAAMEGILQMSEAQAKSISTIADAVSDIRFALERQGSAMHDLKDAVSDMKTEQISDALLSDIHAKIKSLSEAWNIMLSSSSALEERLSKLEAKTDNINENIAALFERLEGDVRQVLMAVKDEAQKREELIERINAARIAAQRAAEGVEEMREVAEINRQALKSLRERAEANAAMIEANRKAIEILSSELGRKLDDMHGAWHKVEVENFEEMQKINLILTELRTKFENLEQLINELKPRRRAPAKRRAPAARPTLRPTALVDYRAIEEMIVNYVRESGRVTIEPIRRHTGIGETTLRKILHRMARNGKLISQKQGKFVYYSVR